MAKRIIIISSFPLLVAIAVIAIILAGIGHGQPASPPVPIDSARTNIISLADAGKLTEMDAAVNKLATDYTDTAILTTNYYIIADSFAWRRMNDRANRLYQLVIDKSADSSLVVKARLGLARVEILGLIEEKKFSIAQEKLDSMIADFNDEPALPVALFHIGQEFFWKSRYIEAQDAFDHISPADSLSQMAKLWSARSNICSLIGKSPDKQIVAAIDKLMSDFAEDAGLAEAVYWIGKEYEWKKGSVGYQVGGYDNPNSVYQRIMQEFGDTPFGVDAEWDQKRLTHRMKIFKLISEPNQAATDAAIEAMTTDLKGRPELVSELHWIACGYEDQHKGEQAKQIDKRIIQEYPGTGEANEAALDIRRLDIENMLESGDTNSADALLDKFVTDFNQNPYTGICLGRSVRGFYIIGAEFRKKGQPEKARRYQEIAVELWQKLPKDKLQRGMETAYLYLYAGANYLELKSWDNTIEVFQKLLDDYPGFEHACTAQTAMSYCYEQLRDSGSLPKEQVNPIIEETYKAILTNYPDCYAGKEVSYRMAGLMLEKGDKTSAATYYNIFLQAANSESERMSTIYKGKKPPPDKRIETTQAKLIELTAEGGNK